MRASGSTLLLFLVMAACERSSQPDSNTGAAADTATHAAPRVDTLAIELFFTRAESTVVVSRAVPDTAPALTLAMRELLRGPTEEERRQGIASWFSAETADLLRSAEIDADGRATLDFKGLPETIPNASSSAGSGQLLESLRRTTFQFSHVQSAEYRLDGSCEAFWNWLQRGCTIVRRNDTHTGGGSR